MPHARQNDELRAGDLLVAELAVFDRCHEVGVAAEDEGGDSDVAHVDPAVRHVVSDRGIWWAGCGQLPTISFSPAMIWSKSSSCTSPSFSPNRSTDRVRIWLILTHDGLGNPAEGKG